MSTDKADMLDQEVISILSQGPGDPCIQPSLLTIWPATKPVIPAIAPLVSRREDFGSARFALDRGENLPLVQATSREETIVPLALEPIADQNIQRQIQEHKDRPKQGLTFRSAAHPSVHHSLRRL